MDKLTIQKLRVQNFKGISDFILEPYGENIDVSGQNESGKSTLADSFFYLLFGKDSSDRADFQLKPVDEHGNEIHNLESEVEAMLEFNGKPITLMKRFKEKWTKKRGAAQAEFTGNTTDYFIDEVPAKKKDFDAKINEIVDINAVKLVTNPFEFASLHWTGRRQILLEMCGDVTDQDVIDSDGDLKSLSDIIGDHSIDDYKKIVKSKQKKINDELKEIPARISENVENSKDVEKPSDSDKRCLDNQLDEAKENLRSLESNEAASEKQIRLNEIDSEILKLKSSTREKEAEAKKPLLEVIEKLESERREATRKMTDLEDQIERDEKRNQIAVDAMEKLREKWTIENDKQPSDDDTCPTCGQDLPADQIESTRKSFNKLKSGRLEKINTEGKNLKEQVEARTKDITAAARSIESLLEVIVGIDKALDVKKEDLQNISSTPVDTSQLEKEKEVLESEIAAIKNGSKVQEKNARDKVTECQAKVDEWNKSNAEWEAAEKSRSRIEDLEKQEKKLAKEYERLESELFLIEKFIVRKVELLEDQINSRFKMARFKLFKDQINGGIEECCEIIYNGVPFDRGLNNAARINVGLDIINTLSEYYGFSAPVFIDNRESVNELIQIDSQVISLIVSEDKELTVSKTEVAKAS